MDGLTFYRHTVCCPTLYFKVDADNQSDYEAKGM